MNSVDRIKEVMRLLQVHKQTLERRVHFDDVIEVSLSNVECELILLLSEVRDKEEDADGQ